MLTTEEKVQNIEEFLELLACPKCHGKLGVVNEPLDGSTNKPTGLVCGSCKLHFALDDGLPNMLISEAKVWPLASAPATA